MLDLELNNLIPINKDYYKSITPNHTEKYDDQEILFYNLYNLNEGELKHVGFIDDKSVIQTNSLFLNYCKIFNSYIKTNKLELIGSNLYNINIHDSKTVKIKYSTLNNIIAKEGINKLIVKFSSLCYINISKNTSLKTYYSKCDFKDLMSITRNYVSPYGSIE